MANRGQIRWLRQRALQEGISSIGIEFLDARLLRQRFCELAGIEMPFFGSETLEFLLRVEAEGASDPESNAVARSPRHCLDAMDELAGAGWGGDAAALGILPPAAGGFFSRLSGSRAWTPELERGLLAWAEEQSASLNIRACIAGWDAGFWREVNLLKALCLAASELTLFAPMPRIAAETIQQEWIEYLEGILKVEKDVCPESEFESANAPLANRLEGGVTDEKIRLKPAFLVGADWEDQMRMVRDDVIEWLGNSKAGERLGIVAPKRSASTLEIVRLLEEAGVSLFDEAGEQLAPPGELLVQLEIVRYHLQGCDIDALISLIDSLNDAAPGGWKWIHPVAMRRLLRRAFKKVQSRNARVLAGAAPERLSETWGGVAELIEDLGHWPERTNWRDARERWERCLGGFGLSTEILEPLWSRIAALLGTEEFSSRLFLEYLTSLLRPVEIRRAEASRFPYARVVVTTFESALGQTWDRLVLLDSNDGIWPAKIVENPFLDDRDRVRLNTRRRDGQPRLLLSVEEAGLEQARFLDLMESCRGQVVFAAASRDPSDTEREAYPNEWSMRALIETTDDGPLEAVDHLWKRPAVTSPGRNPALDKKEADHLAEVFRERRNPLRPFDEYSFHFGNLAKELKPWPAAGLDEALSCPATFALREIFGAESDEKGFERSERLAIGTAVHAWVVRVSGGGPGLRAFRAPEKIEPLLDTAWRETRAALEEKFKRAEIELPLWWESALKKACWTARKCLSPLVGKRDRFFAMEEKLECSVATNRGPLELSGRLDLIFSDRDTLQDAVVEIWDFKTGKAKAPAIAELRKGEGFQLAAYFLMAKALGAASVSVGIIQPEAGLLAGFEDGDEEDLRAALGPLARMRQTMLFGQRGPFIAEWGACEALPMATTPIPQHILEAKAGMVLLA